MMGQANRQRALRAGALGGDKLAQNCVAALRPARVIDVGADELGSKPGLNNRQLNNLKFR